MVSSDQRIHLLPGHGGFMVLKNPVQLAVIQPPHLDGAVYLVPIICFTPLVLLLTSFMEKQDSGSGINGLLLAAPIADAVAGIVIVILTVSFFKKIKKA